MAFSSSFLVSYTQGWHRSKLFLGRPPASKERVTNLKGEGCIAPQGNLSSPPPLLHGQRMCEVANWKCQLA
eukprot:1161322-Pelagomonas_calceolata.AAC.2